jgi:hypothetical protein
MPERKIEIQMAAVGADSAAAAIDQTTASVDSLSAAEANSDEALKERLKALKDRLAGMEDEMKALKDEAVEQEQAEVKRASRLKEVGVALGAVAAAAGFARASFASLADSVKSLDLNQIGKLDPEFAANLQEIRDFGADMEAFAAGMESPMQTVVGLWERLLLAGRTVAEEVAIINDSIATAEADHEQIIQGIIDRGITQADSLKKLATEIAEANKVLDAKDSADAAAAKRDDARKIREGADPFEVEKAAASRDAQREIDRLEREQAAKESNAAEQSKNADQAARNAYRVIQNPAASDEDRVKAGREAEDAAAAAAEANKKADTDRRITEEKIREAREKEAARQEAAAGAQEKRQRDQEREYSDMRERAAAAEAAREQREEQAAERQEAARRNQTRSTAGAAMGIADGAERAGATSGFVDALRGRAAAAQANPSAANAAALAQMLDQLLTAIERGKAGDEQEAAALKRRITALERREKNR